MHSGAGQLDHWRFLQVLRSPEVHGWLVEPQVDIGSSEASASHALVVDRQTGQAWIAPLAFARVIVRHQTVAVGEVPS